MEGGVFFGKKSQRLKKYPIQIKEKAIKLYYEDMLHISTISSLLSIDRKMTTLSFTTIGGS